ncbi:DNA helicase [Tanacetum coccineum]
MDYVRTHQKDIRSNHLSGLYDAIGRGDLFGIAIGSKILLPTSFTGGPRYMYSHYLDALLICRSLENPQFFITFTCNVYWPEIKRYWAQYPELTLADRPDIVCRVFEQKVKDFVRFLREVETFREVTGVLYIIEFQKRGLPHCHTLLSVDPKNKIETIEQVDQCILAELLDPKEYPFRNKIVSDMMIHGPCGGANSNPPCMQKGCTSPLDIRTINNQLLSTYHAASEALGLLGNDKENSVKDSGLPNPLIHLLEDLKNKLLMEEKNYKRGLLMQEKIDLVLMLNTDQRRI